ncbi:MAG TPA: hypothetical protein PKC39_16060, partial [Ferruginibacter sp.]|nr:hypothetical protein [Ferruginibacter sp.]HMP22472.1 hypothetical protein [Ferruginibacter sp.]
MNLESKAQQRVVSFQGAVANWTTDSNIVVTAVSTSSSSVSVPCLNGSNQAYPSLNSTAGYYRFTLNTEDEKIDSMRVVWRSNTTNQRIVAIFGTTEFALASSVYSLSGGESGGFTTFFLAGSGATNCTGETKVFPSEINVKSVLFGRQMSNTPSTNTELTAYTNYAIRQGGSSGAYTQVYGAGSTAYLGQIIFYISKLCSNPNTYSVGGTTTICSDAGTTDITLSSSQSGVSYQLFKDNVADGAPIEGTGSALAWPVSAAGTYTVKSVANETYCDVSMTGSAVITVNQAPSISSESLSGANYIQGDAAAALSITASGTSPTYQWYSNATASNTGGTSIDGAESNTYTPSTATAGTTYYYCVVSVANCSDVASNPSGAIVVEEPTDPTVIVEQAGFDPAFGNVQVNTSSAPRTISVSGVNLTANLVVSAPEGFEVSEDENSGYAASVQLTPSGGSVAATTIYVRFSPTAATGYSGDLTATSTGANTVEIGLSGTGVIPSITIDETALNFNVTGWATSTPQSTAITGADLVDDIEVSVDAPFQVSNNNSTWNTSTTYVPSSGSVSGTLYIRYNPSSGTGSDNSTVSITSPGASGKSIDVAGKAAPVITLSSGSATQLVKAGNAITNIVYTVTGGVSNISASGLPASGITFNDGTYTISGTAATESSYPAVYDYTVTVVGPAETPNATANGTLTIKDPAAKNIAYIINTAVSANDTKIRPYLDARYDLTNILIGSVTTSTDFSAYDAVVLTELPGSGSAGMRALWGIDKPLLNLKAFATQANTWAFSGASGVNVTASTQIDVVDESHPVFNDVNIVDGKVTLLENSPTGNAIQATTYAGGIKLGYISGSTVNVAVNEIEVGQNPSGGSPTGVKNPVLQAKYMQIGIADGNIGKITADGLKMIDNALKYIMTSASCTSFVFNGSGSFSNPSNWACGVVPSSESDNEVVIEGDATLDASYQIGAGGSFSIATGGSLSIGA